MTDWLRIRNNILNILFCLTSAILLVIIASVIFYQIDLKTNFSAFNVGFTKAELNAEYLHLLNYLMNPMIEKLQFLFFGSSNSGLQHFSDVKSLLLVNTIVFITSICLKIGLKIKLRFYKNDAIVIGMIPIVIGLIALMNFDEFFVMFHQLLFTNNDWLFNPMTDPIINVLPEYFFEQLIILFFIIFEMLVFLGYWNKKRAKSLI